MYEIIQKILTMTLEEFKVWEVPKGWKLLYVNGCEKIGAPSYDPKYDCVKYFGMSVTIEKEKEHEVL